MKKKQVKLVIVIPVGPNSIINYVLDTIDSVKYYTTPDRKIIIIDDSRKGMGRKLQLLHPDLDITTTKKVSGLFGGLYISLSLGFAYAIENYSFETLLRLDTDALIIGTNPEDDAIREFRKNPDVGLAGQYPCEYNGKPWDYSWPRDQILKQIYTPRSRIGHPIRGWALHTMYTKAAKNGYRPGENVFGGAYFMTEEALIQLRRAGLLPNMHLKTAYLGEDHLFGLLIKVIGKEMGDLATGNLPLACAWRGLPCEPQELIEKGKKITHSTRFWQDMQEDEIRAFFKSYRQ